MAVLTQKNTTPPDGFKYLQPETGLWISGDFLSELVERVCAHRQHKGIAPWDAASVEKEVVNQICMAAPKGVCRGEEGESYEPFRSNIRRLSLTKIATATEVLIEWLRSGMHIVPKEESQRRAAICRGCPMNQIPSACICTPFWKMLEKIIPQDRKEPGLHICAICGCANAAKILVPLSVAIESTAGLRVPQHCWIKTP